MPASRCRTSCRAGCSSGSRSPGRSPRGPDVVLLDEPFSNLDAALRTQLRGDVREILRAAGATAVLVTHDQDEALTLGDRMAVMVRGRIEQCDAPEVVYGEPATPFVATFVGRPTSSTPSAFMVPRQSGRPANHRTDGESALDAAARSLSELPTMLADSGADVEVLEDMEEISAEMLARQGEEAPVIKLVNVVLMWAISKGASDIHIEPYKRNTACATASTAFSTTSWRRR